MIADDFKDIRSRMKGDLKPKKPLKCEKCGGRGWIDYRHCECECAGAGPLPKPEEGLFG